MSVPISPLPGQTSTSIAETTGKGALPPWLTIRARDPLSNVYSASFSDLQELNDGVQIMDQKMNRLPLGQNLLTQAEVQKKLEEIMKASAPYKMVFYTQAEYGAKKRIWLEALNMKEGYKSAVAQSYMSADLAQLHESGNLTDHDKDGSCVIT